MPSRSPPLCSPQVRPCGTVFLPRLSSGQGQGRETLSGEQCTHAPLPETRRPRPQSVLRGDACTLDSGSLSSPAWEPRCAGGRKLRPGWPTASQSPTWVSWWAWRLCGKPPSSHGSSFDIKLHSTTDTGAEELGETQLAGKWGSELLHPSPLPASPPLYLPHPGETGH